MTKEKEKNNKRAVVDDKKKENVHPCVRVCV